MDNMDSSIVTTPEEKPTDNLADNLPEIKILERVFDWEQAKTHLKIFVGDPFNTIVYKSGGLGRIAFQLIEQFGFPVFVKDLTEILAPQVNAAAFHETSLEESMYYAFHSWLLEKGSDYFSRGQMWYVSKNEKRYIRATAEPIGAFFAAQGVPDRKSREGVLHYWREKKWLRSGGERRLNKNVRITFPNGEKGVIQVYEILISENLPADDEEPAPATYTIV